MQRTWRPGRVILAGLFLALAVAAYAFWPATVRWRVERDDRNVIGFCPSKNVVWTVNGYLDSSSPDASDHLSGLDIASGSRILGQSLPYGSFLTSDNILSSDGQYLAVHQPALKKINIIHAITGESIIQITPALNSASAPNYYDVTFSDDGHWFVLSNLTTIEVWDLRIRCRQHEYDLKQLDQGDVRVKTLTQAHSDFMHSRPSLNISKDGHYLAFWKEQVLSVFELDTMRMIGQAECLGSPQFMPDGTIAAFQAESYPLNPWNSSFVIENNELKCVRQNTEMQKVKIVEHNELHVAQNETRYVTIQWPSNRLRSPEWIPNSVQPLLNEWLSKLNKHWRFTLRDLATGKEVAQFGVRYVEDSTPFISFSVASGTFVSGLNNHDSIPFRVFISPDHCWLVKQDRGSIELWPLLTYWRPWYCWVTVAGLVLIAVYFVWYCRRVVAADMPGK